MYADFVNELAQVAAPQGWPATPAGASGQHPPLRRLIPVAQETNCELAPHQPVLSPLPLPH